MNGKEEAEDCNIEVHKAKKPCLGKEETKAVILWADPVKKMKSGQEAQPKIWNTYKLRLSFDKTYF